MNKFSVIVVLMAGLFGMACSAEVDSEDTGSLEADQTFGAREFAPKNGSLIPSMPGDSTFKVFSTCTGKTEQEILNCFGALNAQCTSAGGVGLSSHLKGRADRTGQFNIAGTCVVRAAAE